MRKWDVGTVTKTAFDNFIQKTRLSGGIHQKDRKGEGRLKCLACPSNWRVYTATLVARAHYCSCVEAGVLVKETKMLFP
jgi:hypothetical protein